MSLVYVASKNSTENKACLNHRFKSPHRAPIGPTWEPQRDGPFELGHARELWVGEIFNLFFFKALTRELQCPAVLHDRANDLIRGT